MANRVEPNEVLDIITTSRVDIQPFITAANLLVTDVLGSSDLSTEQLKEIERWLSAHFVSISDGGSGEVIEREVGETRIKYATITGKNLGTTRYGQQALFLDTTGLLSKVGKGRARFDAL
jgi:hypothetical protein